MVIDRSSRPHEHEGQECVCCSGQMSKKELDAWEKKCMKEYGYYMHFVPLDTYLNAHTHGVPESFKHPDLQIVLPLSGNAAGGILRTVVARIKEGESFKPGKDYDRIANGYPVRFVESSESGRAVLRLIFPDRDGKFPGEPGAAELIDGQTDVVT